MKDGSRFGWKHRREVGLKKLRWPGDEGTDLRFAVAVLVRSSMHQIRGYFDINSDFCQLREPGRRGRTEPEKNPKENRRAGSVRDRYRSGARSMNSRRGPPTSDGRGRKRRTRGAPKPPSPCRPRSERKTTSRTFPICRR